MGVNIRLLVPGVAISALALIVGAEFYKLPIIAACLDGFATGVFVSSIRFVRAFPNE